MPSPTPLQWLSLVGAIWLQAINGPNTDFPVYSSQLKHLLSISQIQLNNLAFASDAGKLFGWFSGVAAIYLPLWLVLVVGATLGFIGYGVQYLFLVNTISSLSYWQVFLLTVLGGNGICWINTVCYIVCIKNFQSSSRVAVGLMTSYIGLSAKVYTVLADAIFHPQPERRAETYLLLNAVAPLVVAVFTAPLVREIDNMEKEAKQGKRGFMVLFAIALATGLCAMISSIGSVSNGLASSAHTFSLAALLAAPLVMPLGTKLRKEVERRWSNRKESRVHDFGVHDVDGHVICVDGEGGGVLEVGTHGTKEGGGGGEGGGEGRKEEMGVMVMVRRVEFWLYFFGYLFGPTVGLVFLNNLGQIVESRGLSKTSNLVSLASASGFFGRFLPPLLDYYLPRQMISGPAFITALTGPMAGAFFLLLNPTNLSLYISTAIIGACTGAITSIAVSVTSELFGRKNFGVNHNVVVVNIPIGSFLFGYLAAILYMRGDGKNGKCMGARCYDETFIIWGSLCSLATVLSFFLYSRTRIFCSKGDDSKRLEKTVTSDHHQQQQQHVVTVRST